MPQHKVDSFSSPKPRAASRAVEEFLPRKPEREAVYALWDKLADRPAHEIEASLQFLMTTLCEWFDARDVVWVGAARVMAGKAAGQDAQLGWRGLAVRHYDCDEANLLRSQYAVKAQEHSPPATTLALIAGMGRLRVHRLHDGFVDMERFRRTEGYRVVYEEAGIVDRMFAAVPINEDAESFLLLDRYGEAQGFTQREMEWLHFCMRGLKWFHRELLLASGLLVAGAPLTPTERRILCLALTDKSEKQIAEAVGQSPKTTHKYITEIARRFGVPGRIGLMALWLGRAG